MDIPCIPSELLCLSFVARRLACAFLLFFLCSLESLSVRLCRLCERREIPISRYRAIEFACLSCRASRIPSVSSPPVLSWCVCGPGSSRLRPGRSGAVWPVAARSPVVVVVSPPVDSCSPVVVVGTHARRHVLSRVPVVAMSPPETRRLVSPFPEASSASRPGPYRRVAFERSARYLRVTFWRSAQPEAHSTSEQHTPSDLPICHVVTGHRLATPPLHITSSPAAPL